MSKVIEGVPESISRADYGRLIESVGLDPDQLRSLEFKPDGVYAEVVDVDAKGHVRFQGDEVVVNKVFVPVLDEDGAR